jgi:hypothetical protein
LPIHIARETGLSTLFASAVLSEMVSNKVLNVSNLKVGGSPLYYLPGQEIALENFYNYLPAKEKEVFLLLKKNSILEDEKLQPAYRVAMRSIRDFAVPLHANTEYGEKIFWRFHSLPKEKAIETINSILSKEKKAKRVERKEKPREEKPKVEKAKAVGEDFIRKVYEHISKENIKVISEVEKKKKSVIIKILVSSSVGNIEMLAIAKDKRTLSENDIRLLLSYGQSMKLPILLLCNGKPSKRALQEIETFKSYLILKRLN